MLDFDEEIQKFQPSLEVRMQKMQYTRMMYQI